MGSIELSNGISLEKEIEAKKDCLGRAKKILLADEYGNSKISSCDEMSQEFVDNIVTLHDSLQEILSKSTRKSSLELIFSQYHRLRWLMEGDRNECSNSIDEDTVRNLFGLEADLYRAMWLSCLILLSAIKTSNREQYSRKRSRRELGNRTSDNRRRNILLQTTIRQCRLLVRLLEQIECQPESKLVRSGHDTANNHGDHHSENMWDERILEWTNDNSDDDDDDDDDDNSLNILSFTKEQLEKEEQQLLDMAAVPIPKEAKRNQQQKTCTTLNRSTNGNAIETNMLLIGRLIANAAEASFSAASVLVKLDGWGVLRATRETSLDNDGIVDIEKDRWWWSLTSQSVVHCDHNDSPNKIQICNVISIRTADLTTIVLDVGRDSMLWLEQVSKILANTKRHSRDKLVKEQEDIEKLWPVDEVVAAKIKSRELFVRKIRERK